MSRCKNMFLEILKKNPNCDEANFGLGRLLLYENNKEEAIKFFKIALKIKSKDNLYRN